MFLFCAAWIWWIFPFAMVIVLCLFRPGCCKTLHLIWLSVHCAHAAPHNVWFGNITIQNTYDWHVFVHLAFAFFVRDFFPHPFDVFSTYHPIPFGPQPFGHLLYMPRNEVSMSLLNCACLWAVLNASWRAIMLARGFSFTSGLAPTSFAALESCSALKEVHQLFR